MPKLVKEMVDWLKKVSASAPTSAKATADKKASADKRKENICPIIVAAMAHAEIAAIHPFADGNGRTARILATLILYQRGYNFRKLFALEDYYNKDRPAYYKAIHSGKNYKERLAADSTGWLEYFIQGFKTEMMRVKDMIIPLSLDAKMRDKLGGPVYLDKNQIKIVDFVTTMGKIERSDVEDILNVSPATAKRILRDLIKTGLLKEKRVSSKKVFYVINI